MPISPVDCCRTALGSYFYKHFRDLYCVKTVTVFELPWGWGLNPTVFGSTPTNSCPRVTSGVNSNSFEGTYSMYCVHLSEDSSDKERAGQCTKN